MKKYCLKCGWDMFKSAIIIQPSHIEYKDGKFDFTPSDASVNVMRQCQCLKCMTVYDLNDEATVNAFVHQGVKCTQCGKTFSEEELDSNGVCPICKLKSQDPEFADLENADVFTIYKALAKAKINNLELNSKLQNDLSKADTVKEKIDEQLADNNKPSKKRGRPKKEETVTEEVVNIDEDNSSDDEIQIDSDIAPELPQEVVDISEEIQSSVEE